jgi:predicted DNA-binding transcriptional regulator AlpA
METTEFLTTQETALRYRICEVTLRRWIFEGEFPRPVRAGRLFRFRLCDLVAWEESRRKVPQ